MDPSTDLGGKQKIHETSDLGNNGPRNDTSKKKKSILG